jgi:hypothetical protein
VTGFVVDAAMRRKLIKPVTPSALVVSNPVDDQNEVEHGT